jgi:hypothetical protein
MSPATVVTFAVHSLLALSQWQGSLALAAETAAAVEPEFSTHHELENHPHVENRSDIDAPRFSYVNIVRSLADTVTETNFSGMPSKGRCEHQNASGTSSSVTKGKPAQETAGGTQPVSVAEEDKAIESHSLGVILYYASLYYVGPRYVSRWLWQGHRRD